MPAPITSAHTSGLVLGDHDTNVPAVRPRLFASYDSDRGAARVWLCASADALLHFTWTTGADARVVRAHWDAAGRGTLFAVSTRTKAAADARVVLDLGALGFNERLAFETALQDTPVPALGEGAPALLSKRWCMGVVERAVGMKVFKGLEVQAALQRIELEKL
ncbi:hypothetical protein PsYK624_039060 [Phanerochaete sordida]|uniref:Uncharacterized protein n=1 Tax=Phanerochaete sordida TaxID=48140 RepID=A0A9P3LBA4_9APHY|nr:hypothetical protein PsYK624_039060 [Phanerochaete sordida]